ncbi:LacI family transcriptional regulator [Opitutaceae bacterium TAV4]|nr:LacI family transcriptional regulator [Opitutaceae bacterium TAV4]RRK00314.1 LacI family transcriptional regulator [Opitutaceae bacterium TAV3]
MKTIAARLGLSTSTVSLALANKPVVAPATRKRIQKMAADLGYRKNPLVAALMESRRWRRTPSASPVIAFLTLDNTRDGWREFPAVGPEFFRGCTREAERFGYKVEPFWARDPAMHSQRLSNMLSARGIQGVIVGTAPGDGVNLELDWSRFSAASVSIGLLSPLIDNLGCDHFWCMREAMQQCVVAGHRRVGLVIRKNADTRLQHRWSGAYWAHVHALGLDADIAPLETGSTDPRKFLAWLSQMRPQAVVGQIESAMLDYLKAEGVRVPRDVSLVSVVLRRRNEYLTGLCEDRELIGERAARHVISLIQHNVTGVPSAPCFLFTRGVWNEGQTLKKIRPARSGHPAVVSAVSTM